MTLWRVFFFIFDPHWSQTSIFYNINMEGDTTISSIVWTVFGHRLRRLCSVPQEIPYTNLLIASFKRETVYRFYSHIRRTHITVMRRWHSFSSLISHRHSQTHSLRRYLGHTSFSMHGDTRVYSVPRFQPGIDPFIGHPSRNGKMPSIEPPASVVLVLRGRQVSYHLSIVLCENLCNILFFYCKYNKLSYVFINLVFYYHGEQLRAHKPDKWQRTYKQK